MGCWPHRKYSARSRRGGWGQKLWASPEVRVLWGKPERSCLEVLARAIWVRSPGTVTKAALALVWAMVSIGDPAGQQAMGLLFYCSSGKLFTLGHTWGSGLLSLSFKETRPPAQSADCRRLQHFLHSSCYLLVSAKVLSSMLLSWLSDLIPISRNFR